MYSTGKGAYPNAGGIAPRLRGITTTFFLAVLLGEWVREGGREGEGEKGREIEGERGKGQGRRVIEQEIANK